MELLCSVVIPVYNGEQTIIRCLDALAQQTIARHCYEIIVVDDGSHDRTAALVRGWSASHPDLSLRLLQQANAGPAAARNHGARIADAALLLFTDADCAPVPSWIASMTNAFQKPEVAGAKGTYRTEQRGLVPRFVQAEYEDRYDRMHGQPSIDFIDTYSAAYRRSIFLENNGFDIRFRIAEDQEFSFRLSQKGLHLVFTPAAQVVHLHDEDVWEYARRKYSIGYWKALLARRYPDRMVQDSHTPQVLKVQILLLAGIVVLVFLRPIRAFWPRPRWAWPLLGITSTGFLCSGIPFLVKLARRSFALALIGPLMLIVRAAALGSGFLMGMLHFAVTVHPVAKVSISEP